MEWNWEINQYLSKSQYPPSPFISHPFPHQHPHSPQQAFPSSPTSPPYHPTVFPHRGPANTPRLLVCMSHTADCFRPIRFLRFVDSLGSTGSINMGIEAIESCGFGGERKVRGGGYIYYLGITFGLGDGGLVGHFGGRISSLL